MLDVVVVGGGPTGALVARILHDRGLNVLVLEAGAAPKVGPRTGVRRYEVEIAKHGHVDGSTWAYRGVDDWLRVRALGGRTLLWGGWAIRACEQNWRDAHDAGVPWPFPLSELTPFYEAVERYFRVWGAYDRLAVVPDGKYVGTTRLHARFGAIEKKLGLPVVAKRVAWTRGRPTTALDVLAGVPVRTGQIALRVEADRDGRARGVIVRTARGEKFVRARNVVLASSPFETARLLLESRDSGVPDETGNVGLWTDHMVASNLVLMPRRTAPGGDDFARHALVPRFVNVEGGRMRSYLGGFSVEIGGPVSAHTLGKERLAALGLDTDEAASCSAFVVHALGEMLPHRERRVALAVERDDLRRPIINVTPRYGTNERRMGKDMQEASVAIAEALAGPRATVFPFVSPLKSPVSHEAGTCRMGAAADAPVDGSGRVRGTRNLYVVDASVMPLTTDRHPTLTLLAVAARTASFIG